MFSVTSEKFPPLVAKKQGLFQNSPGLKKNMPKLIIRIFPVIGCSCPHQFLGGFSKPFK